MASKNIVLMQTISLLLVLVSFVYAEERKAIAVLTGQCPGNVTFTQVDNGPVTITGIVTNLTPGKHGFHIHAKGDISGGCITMQGHFNPDNNNHGSQTDKNRHVGDLGNIVAQDNGIAEIDIKDSVISLVGKNCIVGRGVVVHSDADDLGKGGFSDSLTTGHAGTRVSCGVIGILHPEDNWYKETSAGNSITAAVSLITLSIAVTSYATHFRAST